VFTAATISLHILLLHAHPFRGTDIQHADDTKARLVAERLLRHRKKSNYMIMRGPPKTGHMTPPPIPE
jgi:hypothetical protein